MHIKVNDEVQVMAGNNRGKRGKVMRILHKEGRVLVEGVNVRLKNLQKTQANPQGGQVEKEFAIDVSNVLLWSDKAGKGVRTKMVAEGDKKVRVGIPCGTKFD